MMNRNKSSILPNSRFFIPVTSIRSILNFPHLNLRTEEYENTIFGYDLAKNKFDRILEYLKKEHYSQTDKLIILSENFPTFFGQGQINNTKEFIEAIKRYDKPKPIFNISEYEKTIIELEIAQNHLDLWISQEIEKLSPNPKIYQKSKVTIQQIALMLYYQDKKLNREEANEVVKEYGMNSGDKLYQKLCFYSIRANRMAIPDPFSKKKLLNKIELFESVINMLPIANQQKAKDELETIKSNCPKEFQ